MKSILVFITVLFPILAAAVMPLTALAGIEPQQKELDQAKVSVNARELEVSTGVISRKWKWTGAGWVTTSLRNTAENRDFVPNTTIPVTAGTSPRNTAASTSKISWKDCHHT